MSSLDSSVERKKKNKRNKRKKPKKRKNGGQNMLLSVKSYAFQMNS